MFIHTAADPVVECLTVPDLCLAVGEQFALQGKRVLVLLTDMTAFADALKEISIIMDDPFQSRLPGGSVYPDGPALRKGGRLRQRRFNDRTGLRDHAGDDVTHPVPDNTGYITEGQFYSAQRPDRAVGSLSRLKQQVNGKTRDDHRAIMDACIQFYACAGKAGRNARWVSKCTSGTRSC